MGEIEIIQETPISLVDVKEKLSKIKREGEPGFRTKKMDEYLTNFVKLKEKEAVAIREKLKGLNILRLNEKCMVKLVDLHPEDQDSVRLILSSENVTVKPEELKNIVECLK